MNIWAFDLATNVGVAMGCPPAGDLSRLNSFTVRVRDGRRDEMFLDLARLMYNLDTFLCRALARPDRRPDLVVYEKPVSVLWKPKAKDGSPRGQSEESLLLPISLALKLNERIAEHAGIKIMSIAANTVRKLYIDKPDDKKQPETKKRVIERGQLWGYLPEDCKDDNRADAVAIWHWAQIVEAGWRPPYEILMGRRVALAQA